MYKGLIDTDVPIGDFGSRVRRAPSEIVPQDSTSAFIKEMFITKQQSIGIIIETILQKISVEKKVKIRNINFYFVILL
tara:strand:- start:1558 stop:1791 length:234 start_codon:yes stop_codon:yes gene_type:complete